MIPKKHLPERPCDIQSLLGNIFNCPQYWQKVSRIDSMSNFSPIISEILNTTRPKKISEIGVNNFENTQFLFDATEEYGTHIDLVDVNFPDSSKEIEGERVSLYKMTSIEYLSNHFNSDTYIIDGDHNYQTVSQELALVEPNEQCSTIILHDTGWPCAYRDFYYSPKHLEIKQEITSETKISPFEDGFGLSFSSYYAQEEGGSENGVRTAVDDYLKSSQHKWLTCSIPSILGLTILVKKNHLEQEQENSIRAYFSFLEKITPFLSGLELNRLFLLEELEKAGAQWKADQQYIKQVESNLKTITQVEEKNQQLEIELVKKDRNLLQVIDLFMEKITPPE